MKNRPCALFPYEDSWSLLLRQQLGGGGGRGGVDGGVDDVCVVGLSSVKENWRLKLKAPIFPSYTHFKGVSILDDVHQRVFSALHIFLILQCSLMLYSFNQPTLSRQTFRIASNQLEPEQSVETFQRWSIEMGHSKWSEYLFNLLSILYFKFICKISKILFLFCHYRL